MEKSRKKCFKSLRQRAALSHTEKLLFFIQNHGCESPLHAACPWCLHHRHMTHPAPIWICRLAMSWCLCSSRLHAVALCCATVPSPSYHTEPGPCCFAQRERMVKDYVPWERERPYSLNLHNFVLIILLWWMTAIHLLLCVIY